MTSRGTHDWSRGYHVPGLSAATPSQATPPAFPNQQAYAEHDPSIANKSNHASGQSSIPSTAPGFGANPNIGFGNPATGSFSNNNQQQQQQPQPGPFGYNNAFHQQQQQQQQTAERERADQLAQRQQQTQQTASQSIPARLPNATNGIAAAPSAPRIIPLSERDVYTLSLPSQDRPFYYDTTAENSSDSETEDSRLIITNRGNKLARSAPHIRRGRLGAYAHTDAGFAPTFSAKRRKVLAGLPPAAEGLPIAPNFQLLPRGAPLVAVKAVLPPAPQSPLDLLLSHGLQHTLGPKNSTFRALGMSTTGLVEAEGPLIANLMRVCSGLRGEGYEFRWPGDEIVQSERERERFLQEERENFESETLRRELAERERIEDEKQAELERMRQLEIVREANERKERLKLEAEEKKRLAAAEEKRREDEEKEKEMLRIQQLQRDTEEARIGLEAKSDHVMAIKAEDLPNQLETSQPNPDPNLAQPEQISTSAPAAETNGAAAAAEIPSLAENGADDMQMDSAPSGPLLLGELPPLPAAQNEIESTTETEEEASQRRRSGRVASRVNELQQESEEEGSEYDDGAATAAGRAHAAQSANLNSARPSARISEARLQGPQKLIEEELPEYAKRMVDPEVYVRSLFVSQTSVDLPVHATQFPPGTQPSQIPTSEKLSPNEQEVLVHDCLTDLHRFLADALEYRSRLTEIRDGVLSVERRRKGMWKIVRTIAEDWLQEELTAQENEG